MKIEIEITAAANAGGETASVSFQAYGVGALTTLRAIASGIQVRSTVIVRYDSLIVLRGYGRCFADYVTALESVA